MLLCWDYEGFRRVPACLSKSPISSQKCFLAHRKQTGFQLSFCLPCLQRHAKLRAEWEQRVSESERARSSRRHGEDDERGRFGDDRNDGRSRYSRGDGRWAAREDEEMEEGEEPPSSSRHGLERNSRGGRLVGRLEMPEMYFAHQSAPDR